MTRVGVIIYTISALLLLVAAFMLAGVVVALWYREWDALTAFAFAELVVVAAGALGFFSFRRRRREALLIRDGFLVVALSWAVVSAFGALPFVFSGALPSYTDAFFETISGFTTTGASVLSDIEALPRSVLFWRSLSHWLGGMGIVVLTVAVLPRLGIGGLKLMRSEAPGPTLDKLTPRIGESAKLLWFIYVALTVAEVVLLLFAGMDLYDALTHTFGTMATGGFSPRNGGVGAFDSAFVDIVITVFMLAAGVNFSLYFQALRGHVGKLTTNIELRVYLAIFVVATAFITLTLGERYDTIGEQIRYASFQTASILTTTGYATADYDLWPELAKAVLLLLMFVGGCAGSTAGGVKVIRLVTLLKQGLNELRYLVHPQGIFLVKIGERPIKKDIIYTVAVFFFLYTGLVLLTALVVASGGTDLFSALATGLATVGNIGPGFGAIGPALDYGHFPVYVKWWLSAAMLIGRLEVYSVLLLFTGVFWRR